MIDEEGFDQALRSFVGPAWEVSKPAGDPKVQVVELLPWAEQHLDARVRLLAATVRHLVAEVEELKGRIPDDPTIWHGHPDDMPE